MNEQQQLKLQSYLDDELSNQDRQAVTRWLDDNSEAQVLLSELQSTRDAVRENELERSVDCSREFYWNAIEREIGSESPVPRPSSEIGLLGWLRLHMTQLAGTAAVLLIAFYSVFTLNAEPEMASEWEVLDPDTAMISYNDFDNNITVVMLYDQSSAGFTSAD